MKQIRLYVGTYDRRYVDFEIAAADVVLHQMLLIGMPLHCDFVPSSLFDDNRDFEILFAGTTREIAAQARGFLVTSFPIFLHKKIHLSAMINRLLIVCQSTASI